MSRIDRDGLGRSRRATGVDPFAGAGGMSLGFELAGFDIAAAVEQDPVPCAIHAFNFPHGAVIARPIQRIGGDDIRGAAGVGDATIDVVFGGAPCQGFSMIGQRMRAGLAPVAHPAATGIAG
jgi:DNA (cytosine-5)-methyltransferase 1